MPLLLGPHMYWVGIHLQNREAEMAEREAAFEQADGAARQEMLREQRAAMTLEAKQKMHREARRLRSRWSSDEKKKQAFLRASPHTLAVRPSRILLGKYATGPDPTRSRAYDMEPQL